MRTLRNVFRRKLRAFLTIFGITIGVFALVVMGAMAEKITVLVDGGMRWVSDKVTVSDGAAVGGFSGQPMSTDKVKEIESVDGVARASATISMLLDVKPAAESMGIRDTIEGSDMRGRNLESFKITYTEGREMKPEDHGKVTLGSDIAKKLHAKVGKKTHIRGKDFEVVGIMDKTLTTPDQTVFMTMHDTQLLFRDSLPVMLRAKVNPDKLATGITVYPKKGYDPEKLATTINKEVKNVTAVGPSAFKKDIADSTRIFTSIVFGIALISLLVGGLSVINTMTMSVSERTREIGIRKAIGASDGNIVRQFLAESGAIGLVGGIAGLGLGWLFMLIANSAGNDAGTVLFLLTSRLAFGSVAFALLLGLVSGLYPSWHAARLNPVVALRHE